MSRLMAILSLIAIAAGCGASQTHAPAMLVLHADLAPLAPDLGELGDLGYAASGAVGFEASGCCGAAAYLGYWKLDPASVDADGADQILHGGIELEGVMPGAQQFRLRLRAGKAGTPPSTSELGREGFAGSAAIVYRVTDPVPPRSTEAALAFDLFVGYAVWGLGPERTSAGENDEDKDNGGAFMLGFSLGANYGLDLK